jgi:hypothetical protein
MTTAITCPTCAGPVDLDGTFTARCVVGHQVASDELPAAVEAATSRALWAAVQSLEDAASGARLRQALPYPPKWLSTIIDEAERNAGLLKELLNRREVSSEGRRRQA